MKQTDNTLPYIETPRAASSRVVRIDAILEARLKEFLLTRRQQYWTKFGK